MIFEIAHLDLLHESLKGVNDAYREIRRGDTTTKGIGTNFGLAGTVYASAPINLPPP